MQRPLLIPAHCTAAVSYHSPMQRQSGSNHRSLEALIAEDAVIAQLQQQIHSRRLAIEAAMVLSTVLHVKRTRGLLDDYSQDKRQRTETSSA
eukprot:12001-Heterococcus_DN1.PRE.2